MGKSSLLKAIGYKLVVGLPRLLRCLYVDQLEGVKPEQTPVELVLQADTAAQTAGRQSELLGAALGSGDPGAIARALRQLEVERLEGEAREALLTVERRSRLRGLVARQELLALEVQLEAAKERLGAPLAEEELRAASEKAQVRPRRTFGKHVGF